MKRSSDRILTTHTGSLPLPAPVRQALAAKRRGETYDQTVIDATLTTAIGDGGPAPNRSRHRHRRRRRAQQDRLE